MMAFDLGFDIAEHFFGIVDKAVPCNFAFSFQGSRHKGLSLFF